MEITKMPAYQRLKERFQEKGYSEGIQDNTPIFYWGNVCQIPEKVTVGHYIYAQIYGKIEFRNIPKEYRTREFFLHTLSGASEDVVAYVKDHPEEFDREFFKDHIATSYYGLEFKLNDFEYMPLEFIDEEMVACAMFQSVKARYVERRGDFKDWFFSVYKRKPEVLTEDLYILGARCFARKLYGGNEFLEITPKAYRTREYYLALCLKNDPCSMEDVPEDILTTDFLLEVLNDGLENIQCFNDVALEKKVSIEGKGTIKFWQFVLLMNGYQIKNIPLNEERVLFFFAVYGKNSFEYQCCEEYLDKKGFLY